MKQVLNDKKFSAALFLSAEELRLSEQYLIRQNQSSFDERKLKTLSEELKIFYDENNLIRCEGRLKYAPLPYEAKTPFLINSQHHLSTLIVEHIHRHLKHISVKQTLSKLRQKYWICKARSFVRKTLRNCTLCRKYHGRSFQYPATPPLTKLRLLDKFSFVTTGIDNFGPLYVKNIFSTTGNNDLDIFKAWVTLYTCAASRAIILDLVPHLNSHSFIRSFRRFVARRGCPSNVISDGGKNFVSLETQTFVHKLGVDWKVNLPLAPWHGGFFERMVRSTKTLLRKELQTCKLNFEELQTVLLEVENILNNRPLAYFYDDETEECLTPNHLLFGRHLRMFNPEPFEISYHPADVNVLSRKLNNILEHFWQRSKKEYLVNLREQQRHKMPNRNQSVIEKNDVVIVQEEKQPRSIWKLGVVTELFKGRDGEGRDGEARGAVVKIPKTNSFIKRPVNQLYLVERTVHDKKEEEVLNKRPRRAAAEIGEYKRKFGYK